MAEPDKLLKSTELAVLFNVSPKTVTRYAEHNGLPSVRTPGGHRRYWQRPAMAWFAEFLQESIGRNAEMGSRFRKTADDPGPESPRRDATPPARGSPNGKRP